MLTLTMPVASQTDGEAEGTVAGCAGTATNGE